MTVVAVDRADRGAKGGCRSFVVEIDSYAVVLLSLLGEGLVTRWGSFLVRGGSLHERQPDNFTLWASWEVITFLWLFGLKVVGI